jgi:hypothetical protein
MRRTSVQDGWYDDNDYDDFDIAEHQRKEDPMSEQAEQASVPVTMTPEERATELSGTREWYDAMTTGTQREIDMLVAAAIEDAEQRGYVNGLNTALGMNEDGIYDLIQQAKAK